MTLIRLEDVEKTYPDGTQAVRGVTFTIESGEFVSIMGPSGSGKSTVLHILGFLDQHTAGTYHFEDKSFTDYSDDDLARIRNKKMGFIFQMFNLLPRASVLDNVQLPLLYSDIKQRVWGERAREAIERVGLSHRIDYPPAKLSGGERQRVAIARALVNEPEVIFADEPTGNLDSVSGQSIMAELQALHEEGKTIILITHETYTAEHADRVIYIRDGLVESDKPITDKRRAIETFKK